METLSEKVVHPTKRLGKQAKKEDERTIKLDEHFSKLRIPKEYNYLDTIGAAYPAHLWGNDAWGDCVFAARANVFLWIEHAEKHGWLRLNDQEVIDTYKRLTGAQSPGDANDHGFVILDALNDWKNNGWPLHIEQDPETYKIAAYGELADDLAARRAIRFLRNTTYGLRLPLACQGVEDRWDFVPDGSNHREPGSWGGHCVSACGYTQDAILLWTWGMVIPASDAFLDAYCDERWAVVDDLEHPDTKKALKIQELEAKLKEIESS